MVERFQCQEIRLFDQVALGIGFSNVKRLIDVLQHFISGSIMLYCQKIRVSNKSLPTLKYYHN